MVEQIDEWICTCGRHNLKNFCQNCGKPRDDSIKSKATKVYTPPPAPDFNAIQKARRARINEEEEGIFQSIIRAASDGIKDPKKFAKKNQSFLIRCSIFFILFCSLSGIIPFNSMNPGIATRYSNSHVTSVQEKDPTVKVERVSTTNKTDDTQNQHIPLSLPKPDMYNVSSDLSLGGICLGENLSRVRSLIGKEEAIYDNQDGYLRYHYPDIEVVVQNNIVEALVSKTSNVDTKRAIHQNSTRQEVISKYGRDYLTSEQNGNTLLEYPFKSLHGKNSLLRFALKNDRVEYISVRTISDDTQTIAFTSDEALNTFLKYWDNLNRREFAAAYDSMTYSQQSFMGTFEVYSNGYNTMIENKLTQYDVLEKNSDSEKISYTLQAKDNFNGKVQVQIFQGTAIMIKSGDSWKIDYLEAKRVKSFIEN